MVHDDMIICELCDEFPAAGACARCDANCCDQCTHAGVCEDCHEDDVDDLDDFEEEPDDLDDDLADVLPPEDED